jgi:UDP-glucose 4-epimerase
MRDFVHISDVARANLRAATTDHVGRAFNVGSGTGTTIDCPAGAVRDRVTPDATIDHVAPRRRDVQRSQADLVRTRELLV